MPLTSGDEADHGFLLTTDIAPLNTLAASSDVTDAVG
jgi:hypothetical protein